MSIRMVVCLFRGTAQELNALSSAYMLARVHLGQVRVLHIIEPSPTGLPLDLVSARFATLADGDCPHLIDASECQLTERARQYATAFARRHDIAWREDETEPRGQAVSAEFRSRVGPADISLARELKICDLVVSSYENTTDGDFSTVLAVLFRTDRPLLLIPQTPGAVMRAKGRARTVVIAWDSSTASASSIIKSMPLLATATRVIVLTVLKNGQAQNPEADSDLDAYLRSHGVAGEFVNVEVGGHNPGKVLLDTVTALGADLLVMGAYGRGHFQEMILGGVTDFVLKHARLPLFVGR